MEKDDSSQLTLGHGQLFDKKQTTGWQNSSGFIIP